MTCERKKEICVYPVSGIQETDIETRQIVWLELTTKSGRTIMYYSPKRNFRSGKIYKTSGASSKLYCESQELGRGAVTGCPLKGE